MTAEPTEHRRESTRKPVRADLPPEVQALLLELERLSGAAGLSFTVVVGKVSENGVKVRAAQVTRWRDGSAFPTRDLAVRWARACAGDEEYVATLHATALPAYETWKAANRVRRKRVDSPPAAARPVALPATPDRRQWAHRNRMAIVIVIVSAVGVGAVAFAFSIRDNRRNPPPVPGLIVPPCSWPIRQPSPMAWDFTRPTGQRTSLMYKVPSGQGSHDVAVLAGGAALQPFLATAPGLDAAGVIIGIDPARSDVNRAHPVRYDILEPQPEGAPPRLLGTTDTAVDRQNNNTEATGTFRPPVRIIPGRLYVLRLTNLSDYPIGLYVNSRDGTDRTVKVDADVCITDTIEPFSSSGWVLSGYVSATT